MRTFWTWLENDFRTGAKLGNYPDIVDALGQYPPLYGTPKAADLITYLYLVYGEKGPDVVGGLYLPHNVQVPSDDGFTPKYVRRGPDRHKLH
jgi:hypothetical protein